MINKSKKQKELERRSYLKELKHLNKGLIKDCYSKVQYIKFEMNYTDPDFLTEPHSKTYTMDPNRKAYFFFDCPYRECIDGGHDLDDVIRKMYDENIKEQTGRIVCQGWQDRSRINKNRCLCELNYKIMIEYNYEEEAKSNSDKSGSN